MAAINAKERRSRQSFQPQFIKKEKKETCTGCLPNTAGRAEDIKKMTKLKERPHRNARREEGRDHAPHDRTQQSLQSNSSGEESKT